ncbi:CLP1-like protein 5 [Cardamine amara subsp. amara]|uniref:CLP1-like protein 5 n=1 Tax=Cardamine amara subsp. amara TaxID=228776 RepID=A0ABD1AFL8_CARAN
MSVVRPLMRIDVTATEFSNQTRQVTLGKQQEIRFQVHQTSPLKLRLLDGKVEIFGYELPQNVWLTFPPLLKFSVFSWSGGTIEIVGDTETEPSDNTPMMSYRREHYSLSAKRQIVASSPSHYASSQGPRVIIVGSTDSCKSTLAKMLLSWAAKDGWKPTFVDLNVGQSSTTIPGTISATSIQKPMDPILGFPIDKALVHYFGHTTPNITCGRTCPRIRRRVWQFAKNAVSQDSGMVIDTMGWIDGPGYELLLHAIRTFNASVVIVLGQEEKLVNDLKNSFKFKKNLQILNLEKSSGVFYRNSQFRKTSRNLNIQLSSVMFKSIELVILESSNSTYSQQKRNKPLEITSVEIDKHLENKVLAISYAKQPNQIISSIVAGFVCITDVDIGVEKITYISPSAAELPSKILILGTLTWLVA